MTPNKQVSPAIRILRGERDASARATHLEAAFEKYSKTTIERKQMSTTTNFKRIALVAVASLGLGVLSSVPSNAAFNVDTFTVSATSVAQSTAETYTTSSATATLSYLAGAAKESISVTASLKSRPSTSAVAFPFLQLIETVNATTVSAIGGASFAAGRTYQANDAVQVSSIAAGNTSAKFAIYLAGSLTDTTTAPATAGTYVVTLTRAAVTNSGTLTGGTSTDLTIVVSDSPALATKVATAKVFTQATTAAGYVATTDSAIASASTASVTNVGFLYILPTNAAATTAAAESLTVQTTAGSLGTAQNTPLGRSIVIKGVGTAPTYVYISPDGTGGTAAITVTTASGVLLATKSATFAGTATKFGTAAVVSTSPSVIAAAGTTSVSVAAEDASSNVSPNATVYAFSSDVTKVTVPSTALTYDSATSKYLVTVTGVAAGTATITFGNAATLAASTFTSNAVSVRVGTATASGVKVALDKATYVAGEKATITVTVTDSTGLNTVGGAVTNIFATGGISANTTLGAASDTTTATGFTTSTTSAGTKTYTVYMPINSGDVVFSWTGGTGLATANQIAGSTTVKVTGDAATTAALAALTTSLASLRTLLVTLTNLVLKIQKKVKA
jgi:hypothetical protein